MLCISSCLAVARPLEKILEVDQSEICSNVSVVDEKTESDILNLSFPGTRE
jgi:hypothetical protein